MTVTEHTWPPFAPLHRVDGYAPIEDHGLIGDGSTAALVARDGSVVWLCLPAFDDAPLFCSLLDRRRGGSFDLAPVDTLESRQRYEPDTGVLGTELRTSTGVVRITDCLALRSGADLTDDLPAGRGELLRSVVGVAGTVRMRMAISTRRETRAEPRGGGIGLVPADRPDEELQLASTVPLDGLNATFELSAGEQAHFALRWGGSSQRRRPADEIPAQMQATIDAWRRWVPNIEYDGPQAPLVRRSALTLKMLDYLETGAMVAAPTSSLPESIGGPRNWDYRYAWVRDAAFSVYALRRVGLDREARGFLGWVLDVMERDGRPRVMYTIEGKTPPPETVDGDLEGYRRSPPVRWGNAAADQIQHDAYGEIVDCAYQWAAGGNSLEEVWKPLANLVDAAGRSWTESDQGIWEVRTDGHTYTYSAAMCQVALDRGARLAERLGLPGDMDGWRRESDRIVETILEKAWDDDRRALTEHLGPGGGLDASLLALPMRRVIDARHPQMIATVEAIATHLGAGGGLVYRYLPEESPDGLEGDEGAFLLCSFWLVDNLARQGRIDEAVDLFDSLCDRAGPLGLLPEEIDPTSGAFLGNFPQAFSHVGVISSGVNLARALERR